MQTEQNQNNSSVYDIYTRKFSNDSNIITDPITEKTLQQIALVVISLNKRLDRIAELREKFGFTQQSNIDAYRAKLTTPQITKQKTNKLARLAHKAQLVTAFNNKLLGC